jgi:hypothetical protein
MVEWYLVIALLAVIVSSLFLMYWLQKPIKQLVRLDGENYFERFIKPHYERGLQAGIPLAELVMMAKQAIDSSVPPKGELGLAPSSIFRDMVDQWIADNKNGQDEG